LNETFKTINRKSTEIINVEDALFTENQQPIDRPGNESAWERNVHNPSHPSHPPLDPPLCTHNDRHADNGSLYLSPRPKSLKAFRPTPNSQIYAKRRKPYATNVSNREQCSVRRAKKLAEQSWWKNRRTTDNGYARTVKKRRETKDKRRQCRLKYDRAGRREANCDLRAVPVSQTGRAIT